MFVFFSLSLAGEGANSAKPGTGVGREIMSCCLELEDAQLGKHLQRF
jgi:hypothetical protein